MFNQFSHFLLLTMIISIFLLYLMVNFSLALYRLISALSTLPPNHPSIEHSYRVALISFTFPCHLSYKKALWNDMREQAILFKTSCMLAA